MNSTEIETTRPREHWLLKTFAASFGGLLGLALLKFGNPVVMEKLLETPADILEFVVYSRWPMPWAYGLLGVIVVMGLPVVRWRRVSPGWLVLLPLVWLCWQWLSAMQTLDAGLTASVIPHFVACVVSFYLGIFVLGRLSNPTAFWIGLIAAFAVVLAVGFEQWFGGLEETRLYFYLYSYPHASRLPPEFLKRLASDRIFSTLFYPNTLAGVILLLLPPFLAVIGQAKMRLTLGARCFLMVFLVIASLACLYWSGSKGGWLLLLAIGAVTLLHMRFPNRLKLAFALVLLLAGLAGFGWKYLTFFETGASSVFARFDYWRAALTTVEDNPVFGTGPGTFAYVYQQIKRPEAEMSRMAHNDYLQQASDSGIPGFVTYTAFVVGALGFLYQKGRIRENRLRFATWVGLLAWSLQSLIEFNLYVPALAWLAFALFGWLVGTVKPFDKNEPPG